MVAASRAFLAELHGDADSTISFASRALDELGEGDWMLQSLARGHIAIAEWMRGRLPQAERSFGKLIEEWMAAGASTLVAWGCHHLGQIQRARGDLDAALDTYQRMLAMATASSSSRLPAAGVAYVGMAEVAYQRDELDSALGLVTDGIPLCRRLTYTQPLANGLATLALIRHAAGDNVGALDAITEAEQIAPSPEVADLLDPVWAQRARLLLADGDMAAAARWTEQRGLGADEEVIYSREPAYLMLARMLLASHAADRAIRLLGRLYGHAAAHGRTGSLIEIQALMALALEADGDQARAVTTLAAAVTHAHPQGYIRVFVDEGPAMAALLGQLIASQPRPLTASGTVPMGYVSRLARASRRDAACLGSAKGSSPATAGDMVTALSDRELQVLYLVAAGKQNREIADELYITRDTVKKHVTHIFDKLGAANRTQTTARARDLGLLS
ncbi:LuxR C-terminal-related transcriptional regulator [Kribbella sp. NPDC050124]|uniref:LuxR C-terminal-related transcriptional regulator n=1 Tax=Kribbella sp. NPDC050124 TaxID=3364114 RepID=UPI0037BE12A6